MSMRTLGIGAAATALAGAIAFGLWTRRTPASTSDGVSSEAPAGSSTPATAAATVTGCRFDRGQLFAFTYSATTHAEVTPTLPGLRPEDTPLQVSTTELAGTLTLEVLDVGAEDAVLLARLTEPNAQARQLLGAALEAPFLLGVDGRCEVTRVARHRETTHPVGRAHGTVAHALAFSAPQGDAPEERRFTTSLGVQRALVLRGSEPGAVVLKPLAYASRWNPKLAELDVADGQVDVQRGTGRWFEVLRGVEEVSGGMVRFSRTEWSAQAVAPAAAALSAASRSQADYVWENPFAGDAREAETTPLAASKDHERRVAAMHDVAYPVALERFTVMLEGGANINDQWRDMAAFLDAHPEQIPAYVEHITDPEFPAGYKAPAFLALGQAQTPVARDALLGVWRERDQQPADRMRSSLALALRADVGAPLAKELRAEATRKGGDEADVAVSRQAVLHLGVLAGTRPGDRDVTEEATALAKQLVASAQTPSDWSAAFGLIGNMAEGTLLPDIAQWSRLPDPAVRQHVPRALRRYRVERVHALLVDWLARESSADVKRELFDVIHHMYVDANRPVEEDLMREALRHLREQPQVLNRQSLLHVLAPFVGTHPEVLEAFKVQLKVELEERSGLYSLVAEYLPAASIYEVLSTVPGLRGQFAGGLRPEPSARPAAEERPMPEVPMSDLPDLSQVGLGSAP